MPAQEAQLEAAESGLVPVSDGWFVVNLRDGAWVSSEEFGLRCVFEGSPPALRRDPELEGRTFEQLGLAIAVFAPGQPSGLYHAESNQEGFLVLAGECLAIVEGQERLLRQWDFLHCPPGTEHAFVGRGDRPCVLFMAGARKPGRTIVYPRSEIALRHGAGVETETDSAHEAYASYPHWQPRRPSEEIPFP